MAKSVMVCPRCNSDDVGMDSSNPLHGAAGMPPIYVCGNCGNRGYVFPTIASSDIAKFKETNNEMQGSSKGSEQPLIDTRQGVFEGKVILGTIPVILFILGIFSFFSNNLYFAGVFIFLAVVLSYFIYFKKSEDKIIRNKGSRVSRNKKGNKV